MSIMAKLKRTKKRIKNWFIYNLTKAGYTLLLGMKRSTAFQFLQTLGKIGYYIVSSERKKTIRHLRYVFGERYSDHQIKTMAKAVFVNLCRNMVDAFRARTFSPHNIDQYIKAVGSEKIDQALAKGKGILMLTGHIGNWELLGAWVSLKGFKLNVIGRPVYDPRLDELVVKNRISSGAKYIARGGATREIIRALRRNELIGILMDQDSRKNDGVFVDFLGHEAYTPVGPVVLAQKTGAALLPIAIHIRKDNTHLVEVGDEIHLEFTGDEEQDRIHNTLKCSKAIEQYILKCPTQWVWMHERWKTRKDRVKIK